MCICHPAAAQRQCEREPAQSNRYCGQRNGVEFHAEAAQRMEQPAAGGVAAAEHHVVDHIFGFVFFFAPDQIRKRAKEWGPGGIDQRFGAAWSGFAPILDKCLTVVESHGTEAVRRIYLDTLKGRIPPEQGHMLSLLG